MRKIVVSQFISLDGVMEAPEKWNTSYLSDAEVVNEILSDFEKSDAILFGRTSYEFFGARWPSRTGAMADKFNLLKKYVVSTSLEKTEWNNSEQIKENPVEEIKKLTLQSGKNILLFGSYQLLQLLKPAHLIDAYKLYVYPLALGSGKRIFEESDAGQPFRLVDTKVFASGVLALTYHPKK